MVDLLIVLGLVFSGICDCILFMFAVALVKVHFKHWVSDLDILLLLVFYLFCLARLLVVCLMVCIF